MTSVTRSLFLCILLSFFGSFPVFAKDNRTSTSQEYVNSGKDYPHIIRGLKQFPFSKLVPKDSVLAAVVQENYSYLTETETRLAVVTIEGDYYELPVKCGCMPDKQELIFFLHEVSPRYGEYANWSWSSVVVINREILKMNQLDFVPLLYIRPVGKLKVVWDHKTHSVRGYRNKIYEGF